MKQPLTHNEFSSRGGKAGGPIGGKSKSPAKIAAALENLKRAQEKRARLKWKDAKTS